MPAPLTPLAIRFGAFGDMILMIPALKLLRARYGAPCDVVSSGPWTEPLLQRVPAAGERFYLTSRRAPYWFNRSQQKLVRWLRARPAGPVYVFEPDEKPLALLRRAGVAAEWICTLRDFPREPAEHLLAQTLRLARATPAALSAQSNLMGYFHHPAFHSDRDPQSNPLGYFAAPAADAAPDPRPLLTDADHRDCADWLDRRHLAGAPLVLVQPGNKKTMRRGRRTRRSNQKYWPEENWARVIAGVLAALPAARVILCGSPAERPLAEDIRARVAATGVILAAGDLPIPRLLALQARAHSMISVDTGPAHSAAAMGCPLVVLFAHIDPQLYAPLPTSAPVAILRAENAAPLARLAPETVLAAWRGLAKL